MALRPRESAASARRAGQGRRQPDPAGGVPLTRASTLAASWARRPDPPKPRPSPDSRGSSSPPTGGTARRRLAPAAPAFAWRRAHLRVGGVVEPTTPADGGAEVRHAGAFAQGRPAPGKGARLDTRGNGGKARAKIRARPPARCQPSRTRIERTGCHASGTE